MPRLRDWLAAAEQEEQLQPQLEAPLPADGISKATAQHVFQLQQAFANRVLHHGQRMYRHPDGRLQDTSPTCNPYTMAARAKWDNLVEHCRTTGGDSQYAKTGASLRYGINVSQKDHKLYIGAIGLPAQSCCEGLPSDMADPLTDPQHPVNSFLASTALIDT